MKAPTKAMLHAVAVLAAVSVIAACSADVSEAQPRSCSSDRRTS